MKWRLLFLLLMVPLVPVIHGCSRGGENPVCTDSTTSCHFDCSMTIEAFCAESGQCTATWDGILADRTFCTTMTDVVTGSSSSIYDCGNYHVFGTGGEPGGVYRFYD